MFVRDQTGAEALYRVNHDDTLSFGGGMDARLGSTTWTGPMTPDETEHLRNLLIQREWFREKPGSTGEPKEMRYRITLNAPESRKSFTVKGQIPQLQPIRELFERIALRRLDEYLERLPKPSLQRNP